VLLETDACAVDSDAAESRLRSCGPEGCVSRRVRWTDVCLMDPFERDREHARDCWFVAFMAELPP
jgi:hypothetical protein